MIVGIPGSTWVRRSLRGGTPLQNIHHTRSTNRCTWPRRKPRLTRSEGPGLNSCGVAEDVVKPMAVRKEGCRSLHCFVFDSLVTVFLHKRKKKCIDNFMTFVKVAFYLLDKLYFQLWCWSLLCLLLFFFFFLQSWCLSSFPSDCPGTALTWD